MRDRPVLPRRVLAEYLGTAFLVTIAVGSGIAAQRLSPGDPGLRLLENAPATGAGLAAIILALGPVSGAHLNPVVTLADRLLGGMTSRDVAAHVAAQVAGAITGCAMANLMFDEGLFELSTRTRSGAGLWLSEVIATAGLVLVVFGVVRSRRARAAPFAVGAYIAGAYFFTASTSFANPAVTLGRILTDTFTGIAPASALAFVTFQLAGAGLAVVAVRALHPAVDQLAEHAVMPREEEP